jgi:3-hydroxyacyl-[acyl-carrier-protein] dehydratase
LDKITSFTPGSEARGLKCVTLTEEILHDHFPEHPIFPGAMIMEGLAQLSGFLIEKSLSAKEEKLSCLRAVLVRVNKLSFSRPVVPGDRMKMLSTIESLSQDAALVNVEMTVEGESRAKGQLMFALAEIPSPTLSAHREAVYNLWTRNT